MAIAKEYPIGSPIRYVPLVVGVLVALVALHLYGRNARAPEDFALQKDAHRGYEEDAGLRFTAASPHDMKAVLDQAGMTGKTTLLWLGNSQLHTINQYSGTEHLSPYWLREAMKPKDVVPLGFSLPNANLQEQLVIANYVFSRTTPKGVLLELVFDDLREDALRAEMATLVTPQVRQEMEATRTGREVLGRLETDEATKPGNEAGGLKGFGQKGIEEALTSRLDKISSLWAKRPDLRAMVLTDLYLLRNAVFGIKATTVRKIIPLRFDRNMAALDALLDEAAKRHVAVIAYIAPLRPDVAPPYEVPAYRAWRQQMRDMCGRRGVTFLDLDPLVPANEWGTYTGDEVDFMHFKGPGHVMLANTLKPEVTAILGRP